MVDQSPVNKHVKCKFFPIDDVNAFVQYEITMSEKAYAEMMGTDGEEQKKNDNKGKVLIACLDKSGSMSGRPMESVKVGAELIAESILKDD